jgi:UDP-N-acetyl-D-glucosamine dehydrogenase
MKGSQILVLGVAYKPNVNDIRESPAIDVIHLLREKGADVIYNDPLVSELNYEGLVMSSIALNDEALESADCVLILTHHEQYDWRHIGDSASLIVDTRHAITEPGNGRLIYL